MQSAAQTRTQTNTRPLAGLAALESTLPGKAVLAISASLLVALCAHASFPLPFTPVPLTLSDFAVLLIGLALSPSTAFAALVLYLAEGASGLPVFSLAGPGGIAQLFGPTGGFLFAYPFAAAAVALTRRALSQLRPRFAPALIAATIGSTLLMLAGIVWLAALLHLTPRAALLEGAAPFLPGQIVKVLAAAGIFTSLERWRRIQ